MTEFPLIGGQVALSNGATQSTDSFVNGIRMNTGGAALASTSAPSTISNGLPFTSAGVLSYVDASAGLPAGTTWTNGIPLSSAGSICVSPTAPTTWSNGIPFDVNGAVSALVSSLELNFLQGSLDARVTFARADATTCATYFDATGKMATAAANVPRFDYDPVTLLPRGLLIEESRQNLLLQSRDMTQAAWTKTDVTPARTQVGIDGVANTACLMTEGSAGTAQTNQTSTAITAGSALSGSFVVKRGNTDWIRIMVSDATATTFGQSWFNLNTGVKGSVSSITATGVSGTMVSLGGGWYRCIVSMTQLDGVTTAPVFRIISASADNSTTRVSGATYIVDCAQLEVGAFATSIIPTTTTALTRAADSASMTGTNFSSWWNATQGSFVAELRRFGFDNGAGSVGICQADDGTTNNRVALRLGVRASTAPAQQTIVVAGTINLNESLGLTTSIDGINVKAAIGYQVGVGATGRDGTIVNATSNPSLPTVTQLNIGQGPGAVALNGWLRSLRYYPVRLGNSTLQALTA